MIPFCVASLILSTVASRSEDIALKSNELDGTNHRNTLITVQPVSLLSNWVIFGVESAFSDKLSGVVSLGGTYRTTTQNSQQPDVYSATSTDHAIGTSIESGFNYFFQGRAPEGVWFGPRVAFQFRWAKLTTNYNPTTGDSPSNSSHTSRDYAIGGSLLLGYNAIFRNGLTFQVGLGVGATYDWTSGAILTGEYIPATVPILNGIGLFFAGPGSSSNAVQVSGRGLFAIGWGL